MEMQSQNKSQNMTMRNTISSLLITFFCSFKAFSQTSHVIHADKVKHVVIGALFTSSAQALTYKLTDDSERSMLVGLGTGIVAGMFKELYDLTGRGTPSIKDFLWTSAGASLASVSLRYSLSTKPRTSKGL
jgi:hypothetical protein